MRTKDFSFGATILDENPPPGEKLRVLLERWVGQFSSDHFAVDVSSKRVKAWTVGYDGVSHHVDLLVERFASVFSELKSL